MVLIFPVDIYGTRKHKAAALLPAVDAAFLPVIAASYEAAED